MRIKFENLENAYTMSIALTYLIGLNIYNRDTQNVFRDIRKKVRDTRTGNITIKNDDINQIQFAVNDSLYTIKKYFSHDVIKNFQKLINK